MKQTKDGYTPLRLALGQKRVDIIKHLLRGGCGTTQEHIKFDHVFSDAIDPHIQKMDWHLWTMITGEMPKCGVDGMPIDVEDFDGNKPGEAGYMEDWPKQILPVSKTNKRKGEEPTESSPEFKKIKL